MNNPSLNSYYIHLNHPLETNTKYLKIRVKENPLTIKYGSWLLGNFWQNDKQNEGQSYTSKFIYLLIIIAKFQP